MEPKDTKTTLRGLALIAAIESGLLPEIERDGAVWHNDALFSRFWDMYNELVDEQNHPLRDLSIRNDDDLKVAVQAICDRLPELRGKLGSSD